MAGGREEFSSDGAREDRFEKTTLHVFVGEENGSLTAGGRGSLRIRVFPEFHGRWEGDLNVTSIVVPPEWRELGEEACDGLPDCASWIPLAADFMQDGAAVTGTVTSTFTAPPNYEWIMAWNGPECGAQKEPRSCLVD